jgi:hypothetical protein
VANAQAELGLLEREQELAVLAGRVALLTERGDGGLAVIEGSAGIGKTRLLGEVRLQACASLRVLTARGSELEGEFAFGVVRQLFEPLLASAPAERRDELLAGAAALAAPLFESATIARSDGAGDVSFAVLHDLRRARSCGAERRPPACS